MSGFEDHLRAAMSREDPSGDFAGQVLARAAARERSRRNRWKPWITGSIAASLLLGAAGLLDLEQQRERERARSAGAQLKVALAITSSKLRRIERKLEGMNNQ